MLERLRLLCPLKVVAFCGVSIGLCRLLLRPLLSRHHPSLVVVVGRLAAPGNVQTMATVSRHEGHNLPGRQQSDDGPGFDPPRSSRSISRDLLLRNAVFPSFHVAVSSVPHRFSATFQRDFRPRPMAGPIFAELTLRTHSFSSLSHESDVPQVG